MIVFCLLLIRKIILKFTLKYNGIRASFLTLKSKSFLRPLAANSWRDGPRHTKFQFLLWIVLHHLCTQYRKLQGCKLHSIEIATHSKSQISIECNLDQNHYRIMNSQKYLSHRTHVLSPLTFLHHRRYTVAVALSLDRHLSVFIVAISLSLQSQSNSFFSLWNHQILLSLCSRIRIQHLSSGCILSFFFVTVVELAVSSISLFTLCGRSWKFAFAATFEVVFAIALALGCIVIWHQH